MKSKLLNIFKIELVNLFLSWITSTDYSRLDLGQGTSALNNMRQTSENTQWRVHAKKQKEYQEFCKPAILLMIL